MALYTIAMVLGVCAVMPAYVLRAADAAVPHQDIYFNMWRMSWVAHAIRTHGAFWDANIFTPERWTLAMSDAIPVESLFAAILLFARVPPVLAHNAVLLGGMVASGVAMAVLARYLTGNAIAGVIAGLIFSLAPYRLEHVMHLELQWAMWIPLTFLAVHRLADTGRWPFGLAIGVSVALQLLSCVYYGVFLATMLAVACPLVLLIDVSPVRRRQVLIALGLAGSIAALTAAAYSLPYRRAEQVVGLRPSVEVARYSAQPGDYLAAPEWNWLYKDSLARRGTPERRLFVGGAAMLLAVIGAVAGAPRRRPLIYACLAVVAIAMSLGVNGYVYGVAREWLLPYRGLRAPARFAIMTLFCASVLAAYGYARVAAAWPKARYVVAGLITGVLLLEYHAILPLVAYANEPPAIYRILARLPQGRVVEFPMPLPQTLPGNEAEYQYMSTFHWKPLVNGYSGTYPPSYLRRLDELHAFPDERAVRQLRRDDVTYAIVHVSAYDAGEAARILAALDGQAWPRVGAFSDGAGDAVLYLVPRQAK